MSKKNQRGRRNPWSRADRFTKQAKADGYVARSVYKLDEIQHRHRVLKQGDKVVELGCSPGSWSRFVLERIGGRGALVGVDIAEPEFSGATVLIRSVLEVTADELREALGGQADVLLSDMAPRTTGNLLGDHVDQIELARRAVDLATELLKPGGNLVIKVFDGEDAPDFIASVRPLFTTIKRSRPEAVRRQSREFFLVGLGRKGPG